MNYYQKIGALFFLLIFSACSNPEVGVAKKKIEGQLIDPSSVQYRNIIVKNGPSSVIVCGEFNAKNRMGGYTGFKPFVYNIAGSGDIDTDYSHVETMCR